MQQSREQDRKPATRSEVGIILAGSHNWNDAGFEAYLPKALAPIVNVPLIFHAIHWFQKANVNTLVICANRGAGAIRRLLGDGRSLGMDFYYHEDCMPRGPAGCIHDAAISFSANRFVVVEVSSVPGLTLRMLLDAHDQDTTAGLVVLGPSAVVSGGHVELDRPAGQYVFTSDAISLISSKGYEDLKEGLIPRLQQQGMDVACVRASQLGPRCRDLASYIDLNMWMLDRLVALERSFGETSVQRTVIADPTATIAPGARIEGPCLIGSNTLVEDGAVLVGPVVIGNNCRVESGAIIRRSVIWDRSVVYSMSNLDETVVTTDDALATGTVRFNHRDKNVRTTANYYQHVIGLNQ